MERNTSRRRRSEGAGTLLRKGSKDRLRRHSVAAGKPIKVSDRAIRKGSKGAATKEELKTRKEILLRVNEERKEKLQLKRGIFGEEWLDDCYNKVVYPNPQCAEVSRRVR